MALVTPALGQSLLRLFTVQGSWNYERLQGIGVGVAEEPLLRDLRAGENGAAYRAAVAQPRQPPTSPPQERTAGGGRHGEHLDRKSVV